MSSFSQSIRINARLSFKSSNIKRINSHLVGIRTFNTTKSINQSVIQVANNFTHSRLTEVDTCLKLTINGKLFNSYLIKTKRCDSCFVSISNKIGLIERFVIAEGKVYAIAKKIVPLCNAFYSSSCPELRSGLILADITMESFIEEISSIRKIVFIYISNSSCYVSLFNSSHLFS